MTTDMSWDLLLCVHSGAPWRPPVRPTDIVGRRPAVRRPRRPS